jgi:hypothetical protein
MPAGQANLVYLVNHKTIVNGLSTGWRTLRANRDQSVSPAWSRPGERCRGERSGPSREHDTQCTSCAPGGSIAVTYAAEMPPSTMNSVALM